MIHKILAILILSASVAAAQHLSNDVDSLRREAAAGNTEAQNMLGFRFFNGEGVTQNTDSALYYIGKAAARGNAKAASNLGYLLLNGVRVTPDYPQAAMWLEKAAAQGLPQAESLLADMLRQGLASKPDTARAARLYESALGKGLGDAELRLLNMMGPKWQQLPPDSLMTLGEKYYTGSAPRIGVDLLRTAAERGNARAMYFLGDAYARARGVAYDHALSLEWYKRSAEHGDTLARQVLDDLLQFFPDALKK